jgi:hypothetical protein
MYTVVWVELNGEIQALANITPVSRAAGWFAGSFGEEINFLSMTGIEQRSLGLQDRSVVAITTDNVIWVSVISL